MVRSRDLVRHRSPRHLRRLPGADPSAASPRHWEAVHGWLPKRGRERELFEELDGDGRTEFLERVLYVHEALYARILELSAREFGLAFVGDRSRRNDTAMREAKFDAVAEHYDASRGGERRGRRQARQLMSALRRDTPVVEIGVGTGLVALGLARAGYEVLGVDLSFEMSRAAHQRLGARVVVGDAMSLPFPDGAVAQAYSALVLHHVPDIPALLREVARVLRPGGRYVVLPGGDEPVGDLHPAMQLINDLVQRVAPEMQRMAGNADDLPHLSTGTGLEVTAVVPLETHSYASTTDDLARAIENRAYPYLRALDDDIWRREVEPIIAAIRALAGDDRAVDQRVRPLSMVVMERV